MKKEELIAKIKAEIERRKTIQLKRIQEGDMVDSAPYDKNEAYNELLSFLSTLEEQAKEVSNPIFDECVAKVDQKVREEVRENIDRMLEDDSLIDEIKNFIEEYGYERGEDKLLIAIVARHFYELGCCRTAEKYDEIEYNRQKSEEKSMNPEGLEEELERFIASGKSVTVDDYGTYKVSYHDFKKVARHFAEWGAEHLKK